MFHYKYLPRIYINLKGKPFKTLKVGFTFYQDFILNIILQKICFIFLEF